MIAKARGSFLRLSPTKVRQVIDLIRDRDVTSSLSVLSNIHKGPVPLVRKILNAAISNAKKKGLSEDQLMVSKVFADKGPMWKRYRAASFGRASAILKRTTHLTIELDVKTK